MKQNERPEDSRHHACLRLFPIMSRAVQTPTMTERLRVVARLLSRSLAATALTLPAVAWCAFVCKPPGGSMIIRDDVPPECASVEIRETNPDGSLKRIIPPPRTTEQRKAEEEDQKRRTECRQQNEARKQGDETLLKRYPMEDDLIVARDRALANEKARLEQQNQRLKELELVRTRLEGEKASYKGRQMPDALKADFEANDSATAAAEHQIEATSSGIGRVTEKFEADLKRYRELVKGTAKLPCQLED
jgi:hypothetical protein